MTESATAEEQALAAAARNGDKRAFNQLINRNKASLYGLIRRYVGNSDDAYDVLQETFVSVWLSFSGYDPRQSFGPWIRTIALNKCRDLSRRRTVRKRILQLFALEPAEEATKPEDRDGPEDSQSGQRRLQKLDRAIEQLPRHYKEPLILTAFQGLTQRQVAEQLGVTTKAVEVRLHRARKRLHAILQIDADT